jgi:hypothetical protein
MNLQERIYALGRQLTLLAHRADRIKSGSRRNALVARIERLCIEHALLIAMLQ